MYQLNFGQQLYQALDICEFKYAACLKFPKTVEQYAPMSLSRTRFERKDKQPT